MSKASASETNDPNLKRGSGKFTFSNGDTYDGNYKLHLTKSILVKDGYWQGVYTTDDFNIYSGRWENDNFADENFVICHNNGSRYKGSINVHGHMNGKGIYTFPDDSSIHAIWSQNRPISEITYQDSLGHVWLVESISDDSISFVPSNNFWTELCQATSGNVFTSSSLSTLSTETTSNK